MPIIKNILITKFLTIFRRFPKILKKFYKGRKTFEKDPKIFRSYINNFKFSLRVKTRSQRSHQYLYWRRYGRYPTRVPRVVSYKFYEWCIFQETTRVYIIKTLFTAVWKLEWSAVRYGWPADKANTRLSIIVHSTSSSWRTVSFLRIFMA